MKKSLALAALVGLALTSTATANNFSVSGAGGSIPDAPAAGVGVWNSTYTGSPFTSSVTVPRNVTGITSVTLNSLAHTWRGDLHVILRAPGGAAHNIVVRPGSTGASVGDSGDYLLGNYVFLQTGGGSVAAGAANISGGNYNQFFNTGTGQWTLGIANTPMNSIAGAAGVWTLEIRDWAAADVGTLTGWTLSGTDTSGGSTFTVFCDGTSGCPCGNTGTANSGCNNSLGAGGATLSQPSPGQLQVTGTRPNATIIFVQGTVTAASFLYDGKLCLTQVVRFG